MHNADRIEHGDFLHAIQRLRRELLVKRKGDRSDKSKTSNRRRPLPPISIVGDGASSAPVYSSSSVPRTIPAGMTYLGPPSPHVPSERSGSGRDINSAGDPPPSAPSVLLSYLPLVFRARRVSSPPQSNYSAGKIERICDTCASSMLAVAHYRRGLPFSPTLFPTVLSLQ